MRKHSKDKTLESELPQLCPKVGLNTILISDLKVVIERRACPCTKIEIPLKSCKDHMLVPVLVSVVPVPKVNWYSNSLGVSVPLLHCMWVPVPVSVVLVPLPPQLPLYRPSILTVSTCIYPMGVTLTHRSHITPLGPF